MFLYFNLAHCDKAIANPRIKWGFFLGLKQLDQDVHYSTAQNFVEKSHEIEHFNTHANFYGSHNKNISTASILKVHIDIKYGLLYIGLSNIDNHLQILK